jgi:anti-sigma B factor antagonist
LRVPAGDEQFVDPSFQEALVDTSTLPVAGCRVELHPDRERVLVLLDGELDLATVAMVGHELETLREAGWRQMVLDLSAVGFMDLAGMRLLLGAFEQADAAGDLFLVAAASLQVRRILELTGNTHVLSDTSGTGAGGAEWGLLPADEARKRAVQEQCANDDHPWEAR